MAGLTWLTNAVEERLLLALSGAAVTVHGVHVVALLTLGAETLGEAGLRKHPEPPHMDKNTREYGWVGATSGCVRRHSRELPAGAPEEERARSRCGWRRSGPGRCGQREAPRPYAQRHNKWIKKNNNNNNNNENTYNKDRIVSLSERLAMRKTRNGTSALYPDPGPALFPYHSESRNHHDEHRVDRRK